MRWHIINGNIKGNEKGKWIFTGGMGESVIDYIIGDRDTEKGIEKIVIGENMDLDHHLLVVWVKTKEKERRGYKKENRNRRLKWWIGGLTTEQENILPIAQICL